MKEISNIGWNTYNSLIFLTILYCIEHKIMLICVTMKFCYEQHLHYMLLATVGFSEFATYSISIVSSSI